MTNTLGDTTQPAMPNHRAEQSLVDVTSFLLPREDFANRPLKASSERPVFLVARIHKS